MPQGTARGWVGALTLRVSCEGWIGDDHAALPQDFRTLMIPAIWNGMILNTYPTYIAHVADLVAPTNPEWSEGMSTSLRVGIDAAGNRDTVAVTVVDFPGITSGLVHAVLSAHERGRMTVPVFDGRPGHPVVFDHVDAVAAAARATGDEGARAFLAEHSDRVHRVDCTALADAADIDTPRDLYRLTLPRNG